MAQQGQIRGKMGEEELKNILDQVSQQIGGGDISVKYKRRTVFDDDEEDICAEDEW